MAKQGFFRFRHEHSAVANRSVNQTVHVESHAPFCLSMKQKNKNCMPAVFAVNHKRGSPEAVEYCRQHDAA
jgi:hypothetical protein